ncbi:unknown [Akkermansia sp. CAG:344]|nr:unknown [Akkermansia sp. CAG:344]
MRSVRVGFAGDEACGFIIAPGGDVSVRASRGVGGDVARVLPEGGKADHSVGFVVAEEQGLDGRTPFGGLSAPEVVAVAGRVPEGVGDGGRLVKPGIVGGRSRVARRVSNGNSAPGDVGTCRNGVAPSVRVSVDDAGFRIGAGLRGSNTRVVRLRSNEAVDDGSGGRDVGGWYGAFLRPQGACSVFAPLRGYISSGINGDRFAFQRGREGGNQRLLRFAIGSPLAVVPGRRDDAVDAVLRLFHAVAPRGDARVGHGGRIGKLPGFLDLIAEVVVFPQGRRHRRSCGFRICLFLGQLSLGVIGVPRVNDSPDGVGPARAQNFPGTVDDAALQFGFRFPGDGFREGPNAVGNQVEGIDDMPLSRAGFFQDRSVRRVARDERGSRGDGLRRRQAILAVGVGGDPAQDVRRGSYPPQQVVLRAFAGHHGPRIPARREDAPRRIQGVGGDGFRRDDLLSVHHRRAGRFYQLARRVVGIVHSYTIFINVPQQAPVAHQLALRYSAIARRPLHPPVLRVKFIGGAVRERPFPAGEQGVAFFPDALPFRRDPGRGARALSRHGFPVDARFHRFRVEGAVLRRGRVVVPGLHAGEVPGHPGASAGIDVGRAGQPLFRGRQARARYSQSGDPLFRPFDVVGCRVLVGRGGQRLDVPFQRKQVYRFRGGFVVEVGFSRMRIGVARDAPAAFRPRFVAGEQASVEVIRVMNLAAVRGRFRLEPSALVVGVLRGLGFRALIAFHLSEQQIAYVRRLIDGAGALCHDTSFGDFRHQLPDRVFRFQLRARADGRDGVFPRSPPHVPRQAVFPPGDGMGLPARRLLRDGEVAVRRQGEDKRFEGSTRNGIKSLFVRSGDLAGGIESDGVTRGGDVFHVEQAVPQVPDLPQRAVFGMLDVQVG